MYDDELSSQRINSKPNLGTSVSHCTLNQGYNSDSGERIYETYPHHILPTLKMPPRARDPNGVQLYTVLKVARFKNK